jgi:hypothetical protein
MSTADGPCPLPGWSAPAYQQLKTQRSAVMATMHLMRHQMSGKAVADSPDVHPRRYARTLKFISLNPSPLGFLVLQRPDGPRLRLDGPCLVSNGARFSIGRSVVLSFVFAVILSVAHHGVADGPS